MALEGKGRIRKTEQYRLTVHVPQEVARDSQFPFKAGEEVLVTIDPQGKRLIISKIR